MEIGVCLYSQQNDLAVAAPPYNKSPPPNRGGASKQRSVQLASQKN